MASELALDGAVRSLQAVAAAPELYAALASSPAPALLAALLAHDNADIAAAALEVLRELTDGDEDAGAGDGDGGAALVASLTAAGALDAVVARLPGLDESVPEEAAAAADALAVLQNAVEVDPAAAASSLSTGPLLPWLLSRCAPPKKGAPPLTSVAGAASETLAALAQASPAAAAAAVAADGVDALLRGIGAYRSRDAADGDEKEHVANLFDALAALLLLPAGRASFVDAEGVELMLLLLKRRRAAAAGALRALDYGTTRSPAAASRLVAAGGLAPLFAAFMASSRAGRRSRRDDAEADERCVSILANVLDGLDPSTADDPAAVTAARGRVLAKFAEADCEKCDRLLELFARFDDRAAAAAASLAAAAAAGDEAAADPGLAAAEVADAGGAAADAAALVAGHAWASGGDAVRRRLLAGLHARAVPLASVRDRLAARRAAVEDGGDAAGAAADRRRLGALIACLGGEEATEEKEGTVKREGDPPVDGDTPAGKRARGE